MLKYSQPRKLSKSLCETPKLHHDRDRLSRCCRPTFHVGLFYALFLTVKKVIALFKVHSL